MVAVEIDSVSSSNGAAISSYHIAIDDGLGGAFVELQGDSVASLSRSAQKATGVVQGRYYRVRYRARNVIGPGPWSSTAYILAADTPA